MSQNFLFAADPHNNEIIVSNSLKGRVVINLVERIPRQEHEVLYNAVTTLELITKSKSFDPGIFKQMDKVCQMLYSQYREGYR
jgi:hypothetical protein